MRLSPNTTREKLEGQLGRLRHLAPAFRETYRRSIRDEGEASVLWMYFGTEKGVQVSFPGHGDYPETFDPRDRPWYRTGTEHQSATWGRPYPDVNSGEWVLPCSAPVRSGSGDLLGVVGLDLAFHYLMEEWIQPRDVQGAREAVLLDERGRVLLRTGQEPGAVDGELPVFEVPEVVKRVRSGQRSGWYVDVEKELTWLYDGLGALGWTYVVLSDARVSK